MHWNLPVLVLDSCVLEYFSAGPGGLWASGLPGNRERLALPFFLLQTSILNLLLSPVWTLRGGLGRADLVVFYFMNQKILKLREFLVLGDVQCGARSRGFFVSSGNWGKSGTL